MVLHDSACFFCGNPLGANRTVEHVFPKWLLHKHNLWNKRLNLLNRSSIPYRSLTIPCCSRCNNYYLGKLESRIEAAFQKGYSAVRKLPPETLYQWLGKIFYGILRKELQLRADIRNKNTESIIPKELLENLSSLHLFLQSIRRPFRFQKEPHFSSLVVNLHYECDSECFNFRDSLNPMVISMQSNNIGIIVSLQDGGLTRNTYGQYVAATRGRKLISLQFEELYAKIIYQNSLLTRVPKFITVANEDSNKAVTVHMLPLAGLSSAPALKKWKQVEYAAILTAVLKHSHQDCTIEDIFTPPDKVMSWMQDSSGKLTFFKSDGQLTKHSRTNRTQRCYSSLTSNREDRPPSE